MLNFDKKKAFTLFTLCFLLASLLLIDIKVPTTALPSDDLIYLHGPDLTPIHMHGPPLVPVHMHSMIGAVGIDWSAYEPWSTPWHELYPDYCETWTFTSWEDNGNGYLDPSDQIDLTNDITQEVRWYHVDRVTVTLLLRHEMSGELIYVEYKDEAWNPPLDPLKPNITMPVCTFWHEVYPVYHGVLGPGNPYHIIDWMDNGNGYLDFCDWIVFEPWPFDWWHVEEYATDLILNEKVMDPIGIEWHELYPSFCNWHTTTSWEEPIEDPFPGRLSPGDQLDMVNETTQETKWYYVDRVTFTMRVTNETDPTQEMYIEYKGPFDTMYDVKTTVVNSTWHEVYPFYSASMKITDWMDNCNGVLDACDYIEMHGLNIDLYYGWWHIEELAIDIILNEKIADPTGIVWHELYPDCCINDYETLGWEDNGDGLLNPCDNVTLALLPTGATELYHVENMTLTLNLTVEDMAGTPPFTFGERIYLEYLDALYFGWEWLYYPKTHANYTDWEVVCPTDRFGYPLTIENWYDNCNGVLSYCDMLELQGPDGVLWCHVDDVAVDITVKTYEPTLIHDVAVIDVFSWYTWVYQGDIDPIDVTVVNEGDYQESVAVDAFVNGVPAAPTQTVVLDPGETATLTFYWDTTGNPPGFYQTSGQATISIDDDPNDNFLVGNTEEVKRRPPWYKKPPYPDYAPSGMPDFDQKQDAWHPPWAAGWWSYCGPVSVANSLWWFDSKYESLNNPSPVPPPTISDSFPLITSYNPSLWDDHDPRNLQPLVLNLAFLMDTDGQRTGLLRNGTNYIDMETGISQYLQQQGINPVGDCDGDGDVDTDDLNIIAAAFGTSPGMPGWDMDADIVIDNVVDTLDQNAALANVGQVGMFYEKTVDFPDFVYVEEEIEACEDVVLLLQFWQEIDEGVWVPVEYPYDLPAGGHYVTAAGVNSTTFELLISDPWWDAAEAGWPGDVPAAHPSPHLANVHNDTRFVSHDAYGVVPWPMGAPSPYPWTPVFELAGYLQQIGWPANFHAFVTAAVVVSPLAGHDVAVTNITTSKTGCLPAETIGEGFTIDINATVENQGGFIETFNVNVKVNATIIGTQGVTLNPAEIKTLTFTWNTTGYAYGNYTISATADIVPGETDVADNTLVYGWSFLTLAGDVDGDHDVDIYDIVRMSGIYGVKKPDPRYDPNCDMDDDGDIDIFDIVAAAGNYGKSW